MQQKTIGILLLVISLGLGGCEDEAPVVTQVNDLSTYAGDWRGVDVVTIKSNGSGDTVAFTETLRLLPGNGTSGNFEVIDTAAVILSQGTFTVTQITNDDLSIGSPRLLRLSALEEDTDDEYGPTVNGEDAYYIYSAFNVIEVSANQLVLSDARSDSDRIRYTYTK